MPLPDGMREHQRFDRPIVTPTTKAEIGAHDQNISKEEIVAQGLVSKEDYEKLEGYALALFDRGTKMAAERGLILVDTKYEFGKRDGEIYLIDEDSYARQLALLLRRRLRGAFCERRAAASAFQGVRPRVADGARLQR